MGSQNLQQRFTTLIESAKYDVSCASSGSSRGSVVGKIGTTEQMGICHSWGEDGRCISLLKVLQSNNCIYDCSYCANRSSNDVPRASLSPEEIADVTINFYRRNYIEGLFLSSAVLRNPDFTMELMIRTIEILRRNFCFNGYIHVKGIPGANPTLLKKAGLLADRMSVNIELPSEKRLLEYAPQKTKADVFGSMQTISRDITQSLAEKRQFMRAPSFLPAGQSTQLIVGATPDSDRTLITLSEALYRKFKMRRVYYSAYIPVVKNGHLPDAGPPLAREHRLYQADWLLRFYGFKASELLTDEYQNFDLNLDPKSWWALLHRDAFPVEINLADYELLLRVPGIGVQSAQKIIASRKFRRLDFDDLKKMSVVLKRAKHFITCCGKYTGRIDACMKELYTELLPEKTQSPFAKKNKDQLQLFCGDTSSTPELYQSALTGEL